MPSLPEMVELWREAPEAAATVDLCNRLVRQSSRPGQQNVLNAKLVTEIIDESLRLHADDVEVVLAVGGLCLTVGQAERAQQVLSELSGIYKTDPRVAKLLGKIRLHLGIEHAKSHPFSSGPPPDRAAGGAAVLADLNRRVGQRPSGGYPATAPRTPAPPARPPTTPAPPARTPVPPASSAPPKTSFLFEDPIPPEEGEDVETKGHKYSPAEILAAIGRDEPDVDDRAATQAREIAPGRVPSTRPHPASMRAPVAPGHWSETLKETPNDEDTASFDSSDLIDEIQPTGFRRQSPGPDRPPPRAPMMSVSEAATAATFDWRAYSPDQDAPTRQREAPATARELMAAIEEEEASGHDVATAMRDHWDGSTMSILTRENVTAARHPPDFGDPVEDPRAQDHLATRPLAIGGRTESSPPNDAGFSANEIARAARELEAMNTFTGDDGDFVDYGDLEVDQVEVVLPKGSRRVPAPPSPREDPFQHHVDPNDLTGFDTADTTGSMPPERPTSSQRSGEMGFAMPSRRPEETERIVVSPLGSAAPPPAFVPSRPLGLGASDDDPWSKMPPPPAPAAGSGFRSVLIGFMSVVVLVVGGMAIYFWVTTKDASRAVSTQVVVDRAATRAALLQGGIAGLDEVDRAWSEAGANAEQDKELVELRLQERAFRVLDYDEPAASLTKAMETARAAGVNEPALAFAELIAAIQAGDAAAIERLIAKYDAVEALRADALYQFGVGAALERKGEETAIARFQNAVGSEPGFKTAEVRLIRAMLLYGDAQEGARRAEAFRDDPEDSPRAKALRVLAALSAVGAGTIEAETVPVLDPNLPLPRWLRWVPAAASYARERNKDKQVGFWTAAFDKLDVPMSALLLGDLALAAGMDDHAIQAADHAMATGQHPRVLRLLGKAALQTGRLDRLSIEGDNVAAAELRTVLAYEKGDFAKVADVARAGFSTPGILLRLQRMQGQTRLTTDQLERLRQPDVVGGELVLIDAALDAGDLELARKTMAGWNDAATNPLKSRRWARLLRYEGDVSNASVALGVSADTPPSLVEKVLVAGEIEVMLKPVLEALDPTKQPEGYFLQAFLLARQKSPDGARGALDQAKAPEDGAPLSVRLTAAVAFAEIQDPRGKPLCEKLIVTFPRNPDVLKAAERYGIRALSSGEPGAVAAPATSTSASPPAPAPAPAAPAP